MVAFNELSVITGDGRTDGRTDGQKSLQLKVPIVLVKHELGLI